MKKLMNGIVAVFAAVVIAASATPALAQESAGREQLMKKVRKELVTLPWYGVFDNLAYEVNGSTVTLHGQVVRPTTRSDAEWRVKRIAGVERVVNKIEVLPLSGFDDSIRRSAYYALFGSNSPLFRYGQRANPSIHIVVNRGHVALEGVVSNEMDARLAEIRLRSLPGVFSVTNNLRAENVRAR